jgi:hypothetical protein
MGGKNTDINGWMPKSMSSDGGQTWAKVISPFPACGSNQRPCIIRLHSGRLFFCGDFQHINGSQPEGVSRTGSYAAVSESEGETWFIKKLIGTQQHENPGRHNGADTIGYSVARQAPNGIIHIMTTMNRPCLHFALNEAWILDFSDQGKDSSDEELMRSTATEISNVRKYEDGFLGHRAVYSAGIADNGRFLLQGTQTWYYPNGQKQWQADYRLGRKTGPETYWSENGSKVWQWEYRKDGTSVWTQWWPSTIKKSRSTWLNTKANGPAVCWNRQGNMISKENFINGKFVEEDK